MRLLSRLISTPLLVAGLAAVPAHAATVVNDTFTFQIAGLPGSATATIASSPTPTSSIAGTSFTLGNISTSYMGDNFTGAVTFLNAGGVSSNGVSLGGPALFTGLDSNPIFLPGDYVLTGSVDLGDGLVPVTAHVNISPSVPAVPEPATLSLVGTAVCGLVGMARRRRA